MAVMFVPSKYTIETVREQFANRGMVLLEDTYVNNSYPMKYYCIDHPDQIHTKRFKDFLRGSGCPSCSKKNKPDIATVRKIFYQSDYILLSDKYINNTTPLEYICLNHPEGVKKVTWNDFCKRNSGCFECGLIKVRESKIGDKNPNWGGGATEINSWLRSCVDVWRRSVKKKQTRCYVTGTEGETLEIHHSFSFHKIRDAVLKSLDLDLRSNISDYNSEEIKAIREKFLSLHSKVCAVALRYDIHKLFHKIYGREVRFSHLKEFKVRYLEGEFANGLETI